MKTMVCLGSSDDCIYIRTVSRIRKSLRFFVNRDEIWRLKETCSLVASDIGSFAKFYYRPDLNTLEIRFAWLSETTSGQLTGYTETIVIDWERFWTFQWIRSWFPLR